MMLDILQEEAGQICLHCNAKEVSFASLQPTK